MTSIAAVGPMPRRASKPSVLLAIALAGCAAAAVYVALPPTNENVSGIQVAFLGRSRAPPS
jgi:uncharacterized OsmC-like protein